MQVGHLGQLRRFCSRFGEKLLRAGASERFLRTEVGQAVAAYRAKRIPDLKTLQARLGNPQAILCLGNGPSSEEPRLRHVEYDCLFRVKWRWLYRGFLANPDMVFVGPVMPTYPPGIFGFREIRKESRFLSQHLLRLRQRRVEYFSLERVPSFLNDVDWEARPTNGAVMITTAAALQPARLVIAGIDLFLHPEGKYPANKTVRNEYGHKHDRAVEIQIIDRALQGFRGEVLILSTILSDALNSYRDKQQAMANGNDGPSLSDASATRTQLNDSTSCDPILHS